MRKHIVIPDLQVTPSTPTDHLTWIGNYILEQMPDVIIQLGDFADMESLSSYDRGKMSHEGKRYLADIKAVNEALLRFETPIIEYNKKQKRTKHKQYLPEKHVTIGNHENRCARAVDDDARLEGVLTIDHIDFKKYGWIVHDYLKPVDIDGISYCHFFCNPLTGKPYSGGNIDLLIKNIGRTFTMGHRQVLLTGLRPLDNGRRLRGIVAGSCYLHDEVYRGFQNNNEWRGIFVKHEVCDGSYDLMEISLDYLCRKYEGVRLWTFMKEKYPEVFNVSPRLQRQEMKDCA